MAKYLKKSGKPTLAVPGWLFAAFAALWCEVLLHLWVTEEFAFGRIVVLVLFGLGFGALTGLLTSFLPRSTRKWTAFGLGVVLAVFYIAQFILSETYQNFMTIETMVAGAGGIAQDYLGLTLRMIGSNLVRILLMFAPIILYGIFGREPELHWKSRAADQRILKDDPGYAPALLSMASYYQKMGQDSMYHVQLDTILLNDNVESDTKMEIMRQLIVQSEHTNRDSAQIVSLFQNILKQALTRTSNPHVH